MTLDHLLFLIMSLIWGATWIATKAGIAAVPPFFFGAARYVLVSAVLVFVVRDLRAVFRGRALRLIVTGMLVVVATYAFIYWGMQYVASGVSGVVNMSMNPVCLFGLAILLGQERPTWRHALALVLGIGGLVLLFSGKATMAGDIMELWGAAALVAGSLAYCLGSVLSRPLLDRITPLQLTAAQGLIGAVGLSALSLVAEPVSGATFAALIEPAPLAGLLFLVICGTFIAYIIFLRLMRDWGASRAGLYSFVSPVVALILGAIVYGEPLTWREVTGAAVMLVAAWIAIARKPVPAPAA
ncbi:MAG: EamA family transporter [Alphaproteobacteria bacterium]|nr:MAG: EamA family transporter [Alphaproteobacteria bacterium]